MRSRSDFMAFSESFHVYSSHFDCFLFFPVSLLRLCLTIGPSKQPQQAPDGATAVTGRTSRNSGRDGDNLIANSPAAVMAVAPAAPPVAPPPPTVSSAVRINAISSITSDEGEFQALNQPQQQPQSPTNTSENRQTVLHISAL